MPRSSNQVVNQVVNQDPMSSDFRYISADNHLNTHWLPRDLWQKRLPARFREQGPRVVDTGTRSD